MRRGMSFHRYSRTRGEVGKGGGGKVAEFDDLVEGLGATKVEEFDTLVDGLGATAVTEMPVAE